MIRRGAILAIAASLTWAFIINLCAAIYRCGCHSMWSGAAMYCNIHNSGVRHCPWCSVGDTGFAAIAIAIIVVQGIIAFYPNRLSWGMRLIAAVAAFPLTGLLIGVILGLWQGYWTT